MEEVSLLNYIVVLTLVALVCGGILLTMFLMSEYIGKLIKNRKKRKTVWKFPKE
jgi:uncharacterized membrane-anchored protein